MSTKNNPYPRCFSSCFILFNHRLYAVPCKPDVIQGGRFLCHPEWTISLYSKLEAMENNAMIIV